MWLMYDRTKDIVVGSLENNILPPTPDEVTTAIGTQIFGVVGSSEFPLIWAFSHSLTLQLLAVVLVPGLIGFGLWLVGISQPRYRGIPVDLDPSDDTRTFALLVPKRYRIARQQWAVWLAKDSGS